MIKLSFKLNISRSRLVIACIGSAAIYGICCCISKMNDSPALEIDEGKTEGHVKGRIPTFSESNKDKTKVSVKSNTSENGKPQTEVFVKSKSLAVKSRVQPKLENYNGKVKVQAEYLPETKDVKIEKESLSTKTDITNKVINRSLFRKSVENTKHHEQVLKTSIEQISKEKMNASNYSKPDSNDKVSETKIEHISKEDLDASNFSQPDLNAKVSETNIKEI